MLHKLYRRQNDFTWSIIIKFDIINSERINDLEEMLNHQGIKLKSQNLDSMNNATVRELQEELSSARIQGDYLIELLQ